MWPRMNGLDIADRSWLGRGGVAASLPAHVMQFGEEYRPVPIEKIVYGYSRGEKMNDFVFDAILTKKYTFSLIT